MSLFVVISPDCPQWPKGTFVETDEFDTAQAVTTGTEDGHLVTGGFEGFATPLHFVRQYLLRIQKLELDKSW